MNHSTLQARKRGHNRLLSIIILLSLACGLGALMEARLTPIYGVHITGWHKVTVTPGTTLYGLAEASHAGNVMGVVLAIEQRNGMQSADVQAGSQIWVPAGTRGN